MRATARAAALGMLVLLARPVDAQTYPIATAPPRTTDRAALGALAREREIHERFTRGLAAEDRSDWAVATTEFGRIVELDPPEPKGSTARYDLALAYAHLGAYARASALLNDALKRDPGFTAAAANLVTVALMANDLGAARIAAERFLALAPDSARAHYASGLIAIQTGDLPTARADFERLIGNDPSYAIAHYDLALVEIRAQRFEVARDELERAVTLSPRYTQARFALGTVLARLGQRSDARAAFDRVAHDASDPTLRTLALELRDRL